MVASLCLGAVVSVRTDSADNDRSFVLNGLFDVYSKEKQDKAVLLQKDMAGYWMLFIHFPEQTKSCDIVLDERGSIIQSSDSRLADRTFIINKNGRIHFVSSDKMKFSGAIQSDKHYLNGMVNIEDKGPVPFSACKISDKEI
jgi:hypothetical protein